MTNLVDYPGIQWYLQVGVKADLGGGWRLSAGLTENLVDSSRRWTSGFWSSLEVVF